MTAKYCILLHSNIKVYSKNNSVPTNISLEIVFLLIQRKIKQTNKQTLHLKSGRKQILPYNEYANDLNQSLTPVV